MIQDSGIAMYHIEQDEIMGNQRLTNMQELVNAASLYAGTVEGLLEFLEHIELDRSREDSPKNGVPNGAPKNDAPKTDSQVTLITFHNTKGLEFRRVIMSGLEQGVFPREDKKDEDLEEERRLCYVGATRAMDELYVSSCAMRRMYGKTMPTQPSLFLREIDKSCLRTIGNAPYGFGAARRPPPWERGFNDNGSNEIERRSGWRRGPRLFHDDYGYGSVLEVKDSDDGPIVRVQFETGKETRFLSEHQAAAFVKIGEDD
jgi:DNA helicase-2/ATP-dependent DNA helicase PcrA